MLERGYLFANAFYLSIQHINVEIDKCLDMVLIVFKELFAELNPNNSIRNLLAGKPASSGFKRLN